MFIYLNAKRFPATTADHHYIRFLAGAFARQVGTAFKLIVIGSPSDELKGIPVQSVRAPRHLRSVFFFFWLPLFALRQERGSVYFSNDQYLLSILIFWRWLPFTSYSICSDWHLLTETWRDKYVARHSDCLITTSERLKEKVVAATGVPPERVHTVYGGIDLVPYTSAPLTRSELDLPEDTQLVGYVGFFKTLNQDKGLITMMDALKYLPEHICIAFVGGLPQRVAEYRAIAEQKGFSSRCIFIGHQPFERVVSYERVMDVLAIPYPDTPHFRDYGFPMKVYEYLASGKPIVYSDLAIMREVLGTRATAFTPSDPESLARAIEYSLTSAAKEQGRKNAEEVSQYSWDAKAAQISAIAGAI